MSNTSATIRADWDEEAQVWVATSEDISGLVTEAETLEALRVKIRNIIPDLLDSVEEADLPIEIVAYMHDVIRAG